MYVKEGVEIRPNGPSTLLTGLISKDVIEHLISKGLAKEDDFQETKPQAGLSEVESAIQKANEAEAARLKAEAELNAKIAEQDKLDDEATQRAKIKATTDEIVEKARVEATAELKEMKPKRKANRTQ